MILPLEKQVTGLELSKRLCEKGVPQESLWYWGWIRDKRKDKVYSELHGRKVKKLVDRQGGGYNLASAFTVAELGKMLPYMVDNRILLINGENYGNHIVWSVEVGKYGVWDNNLAEACGLMLEWLIDKDKSKIKKWVEV